MPVHSCLNCLKPTEHVRIDGELCCSVCEKPANIRGGADQ